MTQQLNLRSLSSRKLGRDKHFHLMPVEDGIFRSVVLKGVWLEVAWMWQKPLPSAPAIWKRWNERK